MSESEKNKSKGCVEERYNKLKDFGENVRQEYEQLYTEMWRNLKSSHLEPFSKILEEREQTAIRSQDELIEGVRNNLQDMMRNVLNNNWHSNCVSEALISLEMCKEKYKSFEGHKWNMDSKTPLEHTRPIRMRFKQNRLRHLKAQLAFQNKQLDEVVKENVALRKCINDVIHQRLYLMEAMNQYRKKIELATPEILELQQKLLEDSENEEDFVPNTMEGHQII